MIGAIQGKVEQGPARLIHPKPEDTKKVTGQIRTLTVEKGFQSIYQEMYSDVQSNITHNSQTVENLHSSENKQISTQLILLTLYCVKEEGPKLYTKVCPEGIQPCDMKNRDIH